MNFFLTCVIGVNGHLVSNYISSNFATYFQHFLDEEKCSGSDALFSTYRQLFSDLVDGPIDITFSGTTAVSCFINKNLILTANAGDSRAIVGTKLTETTWVARQLSVDHKPSLEKEAIRILSNGGRIEPYILEDGELCGPERVWLQDEDIPGLAMSRSIGDLVAVSVGVTWEPGKLK